MFNLTMAIAFFFLEQHKLVPGCSTRLPSAKRMEKFFKSRNQALSGSPLCVFGQIKRC